MIYYTIQDPENSHWRYKGLYRMNVDGSKVMAIDSECYLDEVGLGVTENYIFYVSTKGTFEPDLKILSKDDYTTKKIFNRGDE